MTTKSTAINTTEATWMSMTCLGFMSSWVRGTLEVSTPPLRPLKPRDSEPRMMPPMRMMPMMPETAMAPMPMGLTKALKISAELISAMTWDEPA